MKDNHTLTVALRDNTRGVETTIEVTDITLPQYLQNLSPEVQTLVHLLIGDMQEKLDDKISAAEALAKMTPVARNIDV